MKILLVMPHPNPKRSFFSKFNYPCLTLQQVAGITPAEHEVRIIDERYEKINFNEHYDVVGISCLTYNSIRGYEIAKIFREKRIPVVFGGYHASLLPEEVKKHADSVVLGEAEYVWPQLLTDIQKGQLKPFYHGKTPDPEDIPPARHDIGVYTLFSEAIQASRGCPTGCEFCAMNIVEGKNFRGRKVDEIVEEMKTMKSKDLFFADASLTVNPTYSKQLFDAMREVNKKSQCFGNINVLTTDDDFLTRAGEAGVYKWYVGIESVSQQNINLSGKGTNKVENYEKAIKKIKDHGMVVCGFFMFGFDFDTPEIFEKTLRLMYKWKIDEASFSIVTPYPGTRLFDRLNKEGRITCLDWAKYAEGNLNIKLNNLTEDELIDGIRRIAFDFYSIKSAFKRSFVGTSFKPMNPFSRFISAMSLRSFYKKEKFYVNRS